MKNQYTLSDMNAASKSRIPLWLKAAFTVFMAVLVPVYWINYGPTNFLYFCDLVLFATLIGIWKENALLISMGAVGILLPQMLWVLDFAVHLVGLNLTGMTNYMFDSNIPLFARGLSLFHGWIPFLLIYLVIKLGYDRRGLIVWAVTAWTALLICYFLMPAPGAVLANPNAPVNINYVYGLSDRAAQTWMPGWAWFMVMMVGLPLLIWLPTHVILKKACRPAE